MKRTYQVFSSHQIDTGFAADRRIDLRQQGRWHLHQRQSAQVNRGRKTSQIANDAAAQRQYQIVSLKTIFTEEIDSFFQLSKRLVTFAFTHQPGNGLEARGFQRPNDFAPVQVKNALVRNESNPSRRLERNQVAEVPPDTCADIDFAATSFLF